MTDPTSLAYLAPLGRMFGAVGPVLPQLLEVYRHGGGVSWDDLGDDARESQADANRPWYEKQLGPALAGVPAIHDALAAPGCRVLDVGCGGGWSSIALARAYPSATVLGVDIDQPSVDLAVANARDAGVGERVRFLCQDAASLPEGTVDVAFAFECVHDMPRPVEVLSAVRRTLAPGGSLVVMDEAVADAFAPDGDELERIMYGFSLFVCLPDGLSSTPERGDRDGDAPVDVAGVRRGRRLRHVRGPPDRGLRILALLPPVLTLSRSSAVDAVCGLRGGA